MRLLFTLLVASLAIPAARADETTKRAKIEDLLTATRVEQLLKQQQAQMPATMHQLLVQSAPSMVNDPAMGKLEREIVGEAQAALQWEELKPDLIKIYSETFTEEEIAGLTAFYRSPLGLAMIEKMPAVMSKSMELMQARMATLMPKLQQRVQELMSTQGQPAK